MQQLSFLEAPPAADAVPVWTTLDEAQRHCSDPETSSITAKSARAVRRTKARGYWMDTYTESGRR
jgi:hypothetical protein